MTDYPSLPMIIDGEKVYGGARRTFDVVNPVTGEPGRPAAGRRERSRSRAGYRAAGLHDLAPLDPPGTRRGPAGSGPADAERQEEIARIATMEQGKPLAESRSK